MLDLSNPRELMPKDILQFVERRAERAVEILREILEMPEGANVSLANFQGLQNTIGNTGNSTNPFLGQTATAFGFAAPMQAAPWPVAQTGL